ncbi:MAG TPA: FHA domain-containing protein [Anaerolineales bacterium]
MSAQLSNALYALGGLLVCGLLWAISLVIVYADLNRHGVKKGERTAWLAIVALLPLAGFFAYLFARYLPEMLWRRKSADSGPRKRVTVPLYVPEVGEHLPTISMAGADDAGSRAGSDTGPLRLANTYILAVVEGPHVAEEFVLNQLPLYIGRGGESAIRLAEDPSVSRKHAEVYLRDGELHIHDLHSTHGTQVNGFNVEDRLLAPGDKIRMGDSVFQVRVKREAK